MLTTANKLEDYEMKRLGRKDYVFLETDPSNWGGNTVVARFRCSHPEARRRFALMLITVRLTK